MKMNFTLKNQESLEKNYLDACKDERFVKLVKKVGLSKEEASKKTTKLQNTLLELENCSKCNGLFECKNEFLGHISVPLKNENGLSFTYIPCKYKKQEIKAKEKHYSEEKVNESARMKDIDVTDKKRVKAIKWLDHFYDQFDFSKPMKGMYLHGNFGCGKTFLISALFHELKEKKHAEAEVIYFPEILRELKADWELYDLKMKHYQNIDLLCIDDIGAEKVSEWSRDEVLGTILQTRMNHNLPTFFTSNLTLEELESHFLMNTSSEEKIKSRRIMERICQLTEDIEMISENRRA